MNTHDPINAYLSNEMTPDQERHFLISVAASDSLRRALKSEVMIERIITREEREMAVPHTLRSAILAEAGVAVATPAHTTSAPAEQPVHTPRWKQWLKGSTIGAAGLLAGLLLAPAVTHQQIPQIVRVQPAQAQGITVAVSAIPVPVPTAVPAVDQIDRQEQVRTVIIDRFLPGRPVATAASRTSVAEKRKDPFSVSDYSKDNPLNPSGERQQKENGVQAGTSSMSSPLAPGGGGR